MPDFFEVVGARRSIRRFLEDPVGEDDLRAVLEAMSRAPSAGNLQAYEVVAVRDAERRRRLAAAAAAQDFIEQAPVVLLFFMNAERSRVRYRARADALYACQDATIAAAYAQLAAHARGLGSAWVGAFDDEEVRRIVEAPAGLRPVALLALGHPAEAPAPTPRRALAELVRRESFAGSG